MSADSHLILHDSPLHVSLYHGPTGMCDNLVPGTLPSQLGTVSLGLNYIQTYTVLFMPIHCLLLRRDPAPNEGHNCLLHTWQQGLILNKYTEIDWHDQLEWSYMHGNQT